MNNYEINNETLIILPIGNNKSKVIEKQNEIIVELNTINIIDESCRYFGSSYIGRFEGTKSLLNISKKSPIIIEESKNIIFFPTSSPRIIDCIWISLNNIENYYKKNNKTIIIFSCGKQVEINISYNIIDNQILRATRLNAILEKRKQKTSNY